MRREEEGIIRSFSVGVKDYATLAGSDPLPIQVAVGEQVKVTVVELDWQGPARTIYFGWGLRKENATRISNGLEGGKAAWAAIQMPSSIGVWTGKKKYSVNAVLTIDSTMRPNITYDTIKWVSSEQVIDDTKVYMQDYDTGVIKISTFEGVRSIDCNYIKV